jgi:hypothetical protein
VIAFYDAKYTYNRWRPVTAVHTAETDRNPETTLEATWLPEGGKNTAPDPSYPSAHAAISAAAAEVLRSFFKKDDFSFNVTSEVLPGVERSFTKFSAAFEESILQPCSGWPPLQLWRGSWPTPGRSGHLFCRRQLPHQV